MLITVGHGRGVLGRRGHKPRQRRNPEYVPGRGGSGHSLMPGDNTAWAVSVRGCGPHVLKVTPNDATTAVATTTINQIEDNNLKRLQTPG